MKSKFLTFIAAAGISGGLLLGVSSCSKEETKLPAIGGYNSADEVATSNLVAHWGFEGDGKETKSGTAAASSVNATFATGVKGKGVNLAAGYLSYPAIASLSSALTSFTVSSWVKVSNNGSAASCFFTLTRPNEWAGNLNFLSETGWGPSTSDSLTVKGLIVSANDLGWQDSRNTIKSNAADLADGHVPNANKIGGKWAQVMMTFDGATRTFKVYADGAKISNPKWEVRGSATSPAIAFATPTAPVIGAWGTNLPGGAPEGWQVPMTGSLDEMRVYNKALSDAEISALYQLELAGR